MKTILKELGIGKDSSLVCYDLMDGMHACRAALILMSVGITKVQVLSGDSATWCDMKNKTEISKPPKANGTQFEYQQIEDYWATDSELLDIAEGKSSAQLIDCRTSIQWDKGRITKAVNMPYTSVFSSHKAKESKDILQAFKDCKIDLEKPIVLFGGPSACVVKVAADSIGVKSCKVWDKSFESFKSANASKIEYAKTEIAKVEEAKTQI